MKHKYLGVNELSGQVVIEVVDIRILEGICGSWKEMLDNCLLCLILVVKELLGNIKNWNLDDCWVIPVDWNSGIRFKWGLVLIIFYKWRLSGIDICCEKLRMIKWMLFGIGWEPESLSSG